MKKLTLYALLLALLAMPMAALAETVVTSFFPIYLFAMNLLDGVDDVTLRNLAAPNTGCLHDYQLQTGDMKALQQADVFLINGAGMESYLAPVMEAFPSLPVIDASVGIPLMHEEDHHHHHQDEEEEEVNAHLWLNVRHAVQMVENMAEGLCAAMPTKAVDIQKNCTAYQERLLALDEELTSSLAQLPHRDMMTFHEAFPYFAEAYGFRVVGVMNREPGDAISPKQLAELAKRVMMLGKPPLFVEPQYGDLAAQTLSRETGAEVYVLDPVVTTDLAEVPLTYYEDMMRKNRDTLLDAMQ